MVWTAPKTWVTSEILTADDLNVYLRDNLLETEAAKARSAHGLMISSDPNSLVERVGSTARISASETTSSTSYTDLETPGPSITLTTGSRALIFMTVATSVDTDSVSVNMAVEVSGQTSIPADNSGSVEIDGVAKDSTNRIGVANFFDDLTPGINTFTCKYKCFSGNVATFADRTLTIIPF